jgi:hypothetical protein
VTQELVTALFGRWEQKPALVIGGGPSVLRDLPRLDLVPALVISANEHGFKQEKFKVDLVTNVDKIHCLHKIPMEQILRPYGVPIVNRHSWADYRLPDWTLAANTGLQAIALAALLGANPIIVTGIDMWRGGRLYFHDKGVKPLKHKIVRGAVARRAKEKIAPLRQFCTGARIRPMSGALTEYFQAYDPAEKVKGSTPIGARLRMEAETRTLYVQVLKPFRLSNGDYTKVGQRLTISSFEFERGDIRASCKPI